LQIEEHGVARLRWRRRARASCHRGPQGGPSELPRIAIVGPPNVGKSLLFNRLTGAYATVSNYPGTTVEVARGRTHLQGCASEVEVIDTPGMYDLSPITEEERVARRILLEERPVLVVHVTDAKNLPRMLPMTLELLEAGLPVALDVNLMDEAEERGISLDLDALEGRLGIPVVGTVCTSGLGLQRLREIVATYVEPGACVRRCH
jgi:ferrous iron transport protein B